MPARRTTTVLARLVIGALPPQLNNGQAARSIAIWLMAMTALTVTAFAQGQAIPIVNANFNGDVLSCTGTQC